MDCEVNWSYLLTKFLNGLVGKEVLVETRGGAQFVGVVQSFSKDLEIGLRNVWKKNAKNAENIFPKKSEIMEKMIIKYNDLINISVIWSEEKATKGFATDRDYHSKRKSNDTEEELEAWECDESDETDICEDMLDQKQAYSKNAGWNVDAMFDANSRLHNVQSTFEEDMSQYTTVKFTETAEARARAEKIAREIEQNQRSDFYCRLENDDTERDLDKKTNTKELEVHTIKRIQDTVSCLVEDFNNSKHEKNSKELECATNIQENSEMSPVKGGLHDKKFSFNPDAPAFTPKFPSESPIKSHSPFIGHVPPPPGMYPHPQMVHPNAQQIMPQPNWHQGYLHNIPPTLHQYPYYMQTMPTMGNMSMPRGNPMTNYPNPQTPRRGVAPPVAYPPRLVQMQMGYYQPCASAPPPGIGHPGHSQPGHQYHIPSQQGPPIQQPHAQMYHQGTPYPEIYSPQVNCS